MPVTMKDVRAFLDAEEVDYDRAKKLGSQALPFLQELALGGNMALATKAVYLASLIQGSLASTILETAAASSEPLLRVTAASGIRNLTERKSKKLIDLLLTDADAGIRKVALQSSVRFKSNSLAVKLASLSTNDPEPFIRELALQNLNRLKK